MQRTISVGRGWRPWATSARAGRAPATAATSRAGDLIKAALHGAAVLTIANLAYYAIGGGAPDPVIWLLLGIGGGACFGAAGSLWDHRTEGIRLAAAVALAGVLIVEGSEVWTASGEIDDGVERAIGVAFPIASARTRAGRGAATAAVLVIAGIAATGTLDPLLP